MVSSTRSIVESQEERALLALAAEFRPALIRYFARRITAREEIPDLVHDVFVRLLRREGVADMAAVRGYVFETAHSVLIDWFRKRQTRCADAHDTFDQDLHGGSQGGLEDLLGAREQLDRLVQALMELPERTRTIFVLRRMEGMAFKDIAARLGVSVSTAEKHMHHTMIYLMERIRED